MTQQFLLAQDTLSGKEGEAYATINGRVFPMFQARKIEASADIQDAKVKCIGSRIVQSKTTGVEPNGTMTLYYGSPEFKQMAREYLRTGKMPYFTLQFTNDDPASTVGRQTIVLFNVKLNGKIPLAMLDGETDILVEDLPFTFTHWDFLENFTAPTQYGQNQ